MRRVPTANLKNFSIGQPIVIEETFPLTCVIADERQFLLNSRGRDGGWIVAMRFPPEPQRDAAYIG